MLLEELWEGDVQVEKKDLSSLTRFFKSSLVGVLGWFAELVF